MTSARDEKEEEIEVKLVIPLTSYWVTSHECHSFPLGGPLYITLSFWVLETSLFSLLFGTRHGSSTSQLEQSFVIPLYAAYKFVNNPLYLLELS